jgi:Na+/melibiose symporter-like transporter
MINETVLALQDNLVAAGIIGGSIKFVFVSIGSILAAIICAVIAGTKGRNPLGWGLLGLFFSIITLIVIIVIPSRK